MLLPFLLIEQLYTIAINRKERLRFLQFLFSSSPKFFPQGCSTINLLHLRTFTPCNFLNQKLNIHTITFPSIPPMIWDNTVLQAQFINSLSILLRNFIRGELLYLRPRSILPLECLANACFNDAQICCIAESVREVSAWGLGGGLRSLSPPALAQHDIINDMHCLNWLIHPEYSRGWLDPQMEG